MNDKIDKLLIKLSREPLDHSLTGLENTIIFALNRSKQNAFSFYVFEPLQVAVLGLALLMGAVMGGINGTSNTAPAKSIFFAAEEKLAISTILGGG
ncbi:MAG: hypothetical protein WAO98_08085 [Alphaproteobacteria bacterium]